MALEEFERALRQEGQTRRFSRPEGSVSKLATYRDGWRILNTIVTLFRIERPVLFFGAIFLANEYGIRMHDLGQAVAYGLGGAFASISGLALCKAALARFS